MHDLIPDTLREDAADEQVIDGLVTLVIEDASGGVTQSSSGQACSRPATVEFHEPQEDLDA